MWRVFFTFLFFFRSLTSAVAPGSVAKVAAAADATVGALGVVEALPALARLPVAGVHVRHVDVVVALAQLAAAPRLGGVAVVTRGTFLAVGTCDRGEQTENWSYHGETQKCPDVKGGVRCSMGLFKLFQGV